MEYRGHIVVLKSWAEGWIKGPNTSRPNYEQNPYLPFAALRKSKAVKQEHDSRGHAIGVGETNKLKAQGHKTKIGYACQCVTYSSRTNLIRLGIRLALHQMKVSIHLQKYL